MSITIMPIPPAPPAPPASPTLTPFVDALPVPPTLTPVDGYLTITMRPTTVQLHSELPEVEMWGYEGGVPGPTIETRSGEPVTVDWVSDPSLADSPYPVASVENAPEWAQNHPGTTDGTPNARVAALRPWNVVHVHGAAVTGGSDGWTENCIQPGETLTGHYPNQQPATMLWYHDHAMGITRFNVHAGLAGLWCIRDEIEDSLELPGGPYEIPLMIADRNLELDAQGAFTGRPLHKTEAGTAEFFGPFTSVNGAIWPRLDADPAVYRFRVLNASNARVYRLVLLDELGQDVTSLVTQIGSDGGLLGAPCAIPAGGLVLSPAERADVLVDLTGMAGRTLRFVNTAAAPFQGEAASAPGFPDEKARLTEPNVMQICVADTCPGDPYEPPSMLSTVTPLLEGDLPHCLTRRTVLLLERPAGLLQLGETIPLATPPMPMPLPAMPRHGNDLIGTVVPVTDHTGATTHHAVVATRFNETTSWEVCQGEWEVWRILNTTGDTHPFHVHLVQFQVVRRDRYDIGAWDADKGIASAPLTFMNPLPIDENELGLKDTIRVNPFEMVTIAAKFDGGTGRYMYHCHILEHEDHDMMRPFVVLPPSVMDVMGAMDMPGKPGMPGH